jgi:prepilin-type N-terminal cleavage/methylation domain-containing protein
MQSTPPLPRVRRAFSLVEILVSLMIMGTLLAATLAALNSSFKAYKDTTESASTQVVSRMVMHRVMGMIRTGTDFGPFPNDVLNPAQNPLTSTSIEFVTTTPGAWPMKIVRIERRDAADTTIAPYELWYVEMQQTGAASAPTVVAQQPMLTGVREVSFRLEYDVGPRLRQATFDLTVMPNDFQAARFANDLQTPAIRLVSTAWPRRITD